MKKKLILYIFFGTFIIILIGFGLHLNIIKLPITREVHLPPVDIAPEASLPIVFTGQIIERLDSKNYLGSLATQYEVKVLTGNSATSSSRVVVNQLYSGYRNGILYLVKGDSLMRPGEIYQFSVRYNQKENWYTAEGPEAKKLISK